jgi:hypothetical protein
MLVGFSLAAQPECQSHRNLIANQLNQLRYPEMCGFDARSVRKKTPTGQQKFIEAKPALVEKFSRRQTKKLHSHKPQRT